MKLIRLMKKMEKTRKMIMRIKIHAIKFNNNRMQNAALELLVVAAEVFSKKVVVLLGALSQKELVNEAQANRIVSNNIKQKRRRRSKSKKTLKIMLLLANPLC